MEEIGLTRAIKDFEEMMKSMGVSCERWEIYRRHTGQVHIDILTNREGLRRIGKRFQRSPGVSICLGFPATVYVYPRKNDRFDCLNRIDVKGLYTLDAYSPYI